MRWVLVSVFHNKEIEELFAKQPAGQNKFDFHINSNGLKPFVCVEKGCGQEIVLSKLGMQALGLDEELITLWGERILNSHQQADKEYNDRMNVQNKIEENRRIFQEQQDFGMALRDAHLSNYWGRDSRCCNYRPVLNIPPARRLAECSNCGLLAEKGKGVCTDCTRLQHDIKNSKKLCDQYNLKEDLQLTSGKRKDKDSK